MKPRLRWADHFGVYTAEDLDVVRIESYQAGLAQGELRGRLELAHEIEAMFPDHREGMSAADALRLRLRQVH